MWGIYPTQVRSYAMLNLILLLFFIVKFITKAKNEIKKKSNCYYSQLTKLTPNDRHDYYLRAYLDRIGNHPPFFRYGYGAPVHATINEKQHRIYVF